MCVFCVLYTRLDALAQLWLLCVVSVALTLSFFLLLWLSLLLLVMTIVIGTLSVGHSSFAENGCLSSRHVVGKHVDGRVQDIGYFDLPCVCVSRMFSRIHQKTTAMVRVE